MAQRLREVKEHAQGHPAGKRTPSLGYQFMKHSTAPLRALPHRIFQVTEDPEYLVLSRSLSCQFGQGQTVQVQILTLPLTTLLTLDMVCQPPEVSISLSIKWDYDSTSLPELPQ